MDVNGYFRFEDEVYSGTSMIEHRLRVGYIYLPIPLYLAENWKDIHNISNFEPMRKYSLGGQYDRPIPRKTIEDKGISREAFGREKMGAGFNYRFDNLNRLKHRMSHASYKSYYSFYKNNQKMTITRLKAYINYLWDTSGIRGMLISVICFKK